MNMLLIAALGVLPVVGGEQTVAPQHVVAVQANSTQASGTLKLESVVKYVTETNMTVATTNIIGNVTNVTTRSFVAYTDHPVTNTVLDVTLSSGKYSSVTNLYIPGGKLVVSGTALTNGVINVFTEK